MREKKKKQEIKREANTSAVEKATFPSMLAFDTKMGEGERSTSRIGCATFLLSHSTTKEPLDDIYFYQRTSVHVNPIISYYPSLLSHITLPLSSLTSLLSFFGICFIPKKDTTQLSSNM